MLRNPLLVPDLRELIQAGETAALRDFFADQHPAHVAEIIEDLGDERGGRRSSACCPTGSGPTVMSYVDPERQVRVVEAMPPVEAAALLHLMSHDDRADLVNRLDEDRVDQILRHLAHAEREDIRRLASYEEGTAGAVMTTDYATLTPDLTVREALDRLRHEAPDRETIDYSFVVDPQHKLLGLVPLKRLILASPRARIDEIMQRDAIVARVDEDQESRGPEDRQVRPVRHPRRSTPPTCSSGSSPTTTRWTSSAASRPRTSSSSAASRPTPRPTTPPTGRAGSSASSAAGIGWLLMLFLAENFTYPVLRYFDWVDEPVLPSLVFFVPLLIGTGGNAGSQTVGTIIRGPRAGGDPAGGRLAGPLRECATGLLLGLLSGAIGFLYARYWREPALADRRRSSA